MAIHPLILWASSALAACPSLDAELERATQALLSGDNHAAAVALTEADAALGCAPATPAQAGRYFLVTGALRHLAGGDATALLAAARAAAPDGYDTRLGPDVRAAWEKASPAGAATLLLEPALPSRVDGAEAPAGTVSTTAGPHLVQVVRGDDVRFFKQLTLAAGEDALLPTGLSPDALAAPAEPAPAPAPAKKKSPLLLVTAGALAVGGGAFAAGAVLQDGAMEDAGAVGELDAAYGRQKTFAIGAYGLWAAAGATAVLHFVL
ncbi:MAG: hypothetical protein ACOZNI_12090 [Myxococcota bacterium]